MSVKTPHLSRTYDRHFSDTTPSKKRKMKISNFSGNLPEKRGALEVGFLSEKKAMRRRKMEKGQILVYSTDWDTVEATGSLAFPAGSN